MALPINHEVMERAAASVRVMAETLAPAASPCGECKRLVRGAEYHPHLYCVLYKAGIDDPAAYLAASGWERSKVASR